MAKTYLGFGVYAEMVDGLIHLTARKGDHVTNRILLEDDTYKRLVEFVKEAANVNAKLERLRDANVQGA